MLLGFKSWRVFSPWNSSSIPDDLATFDAAYQLTGNIISKSSQSEIFAYQQADKTFFVKRYFRTKGLASWFGWSRFDLESKNQQWFNQIGVPAARVVAIGKQGFLFKTYTGVLVTEGIPDSQELVNVAKQNPDVFRNKPWAATIIVQLADIIATIHQARFCHNDLHWRNILIQQSVDQLEPKIFLIDCPSGKKLTWPLLNYRKLKDLASLDKLAPQYLSQTQRLRFFMHYRGISKLTLNDKQMIRAVMQHKRNRVKRKSKQV